MAAFFGAPPASEEPRHGGAGAAATLGSSSSGGQLLGDMQEFNAELVGVLGSVVEQQEGEDAPAAAAASLALQLAAAGSGGAGLQAAAASHQTMPSSGRCGQSRGSMYGSVASSSSSSDNGSRLTHVDPAGKAAMVDVSHVRQGMGGTAH